MKAHYDNSSFSLEALKLLEFFARLKHRAQILAFLCGLSWLFAGGILLFLAFIAALGWWGGSDLRALGWLGVGVGIIGIVTVTLIIPLLNLARREAVARRIGSTHPDLASDALSASQLASNPGNPSFSPLLVKRHLYSVHEILSGIPSGHVYSARSLIWPALTLVIALSAAVSVCATMPGVIETGQANLWSESNPPDRRTRRMLAKAPVIGDLSVTLRYPEYLNRDERRLDSTSGGLVAPLGTTVVLEGKSLIDGANHGIVNLPGGGQSPLSVSIDGKVRGRFVVGASGSFHVALGTRALMMDGPKRQLEIETDSPPTIRLLRPLGEVDVAEDGAIVLELEAEDDHGIDHIDLVLHTGSNLEIRKTVIRLTKHVRRIKTKYRWSPESVRIGEETDILLELEAHDDDSILGPKPGRSKPLNIRILTPLGRHKTAIREQSQAFDMLVDLLAQRLESATPSSRRPDEVNKRFTILRRKTEDVLGRTARLINVLNKDTLTPRRVSEAFAQIREDLSNQLLFEARLHGEQIADFRKRKGVDRVTTRLLEVAVVRIDDLIIEQQLSKIVRAGGILDHKHGALAELLDKFDHSRSEPARRSLLEAINTMEEAIQRLQRDVQSIRGKIGDTFVNPSSVLHLDLLSSINHLKRLLAQDDIKAAIDLVKRLETDLGRLMTGLEGGLLSFRTDRFGEGERFIGELLDKVMAVEAGQLQLKRETTALQRRYQERLVEVMRGRIDNLVKRQLARVNKIRRLTEKLVSLKSEVDRTRLVRLRIATRELNLALGQGDLDESRQITEEIIELAEDWSLGGDPKNNAQLREIELIARKLNEEVGDAYPKPSQLLSDRDRRRARNQSVKQRVLLVRARKMRRWIGVQGETARFLSQRATSAIRVVATHMYKAVNFLEAKLVRNALTQQSTALDELAQLREDLKRGDEVAPIESRPIVLRGKVEIPDPNDYEVPPEFRKDIMEAMHSDLPNKYETAIKRYYETLVR